MQEIHHWPFSYNDSLPANSPLIDFWARIADAMRSLGVDLHAIHNGRMAAMLRAAGFQNVEEQIVRVPLGIWPLDSTLRSCGRLWHEILVQGIQAIAMGPLTRAHRWNPEAVEMFLIGVRNAYAECNRYFVFFNMHVVTGQKPED